jgi:CBS domain containing-hemolysin-like protein
VDITALPTTATKEEVAHLFSESGYSRLPVYEESLDNITGILYYKDFYHSVYSTEMEVPAIIKPVLYVAKSQKISDLLKELQAKQLHFAVVLDEFGATAGIITLEDILEEIVGEIWDEHDEIVEEIKELGEKEYHVSGKANLSKLFSLLEIDSENESLTVNGWAMNTLEKIPEEGDSFEYRGLEVKVLKMDGRRIDTLHIIDARPAEEDDEAEEKEEKIAE